ncbi:hypothetical protein CR513_30609, partial [Mucuna pruriens]
SSTDPLCDLDPEIELTLRRLRKARNIVVSNSNNFNSTSSYDNSNFATSNSDLVEYSSTNIFAESVQMKNNDRILKELATLDVVYQPWCIQRRPPQTSERIPFGLFHNEAVGDTRRLHQNEGVPILLGWSSEGLAVSLVLFNTWGDMKRIFLEKFFPASKTTTIRKEICGIRQQSGETLYKYWERFNKLCATCPHHQINEQLLIQYFYEGLSMMDRSMINAASEELMDKTPPPLRHLISNMAAIHNNLGSEDLANPEWLENQLSELTSLVRQLAVGQHQPNMAAKVCGICTSVEHPNDLCPTLQETESNQPENVGAIGGYQYGKQPYQNRPHDSQ